MTAINFYKHQSTLTLNQALDGKRILAEDQDDVIAALLNLLKALEASLNVKQKLDEAQAFEIVLEIAREFRMLTLDEIVYCFRKAKLGHYGKDYNRIDILSISLWLREYMFSSERTTLQKEIENKKRREENEKDNCDPPPEFYEGRRKDVEALAKRVADKMISIRPVSQSQWHEQLKADIIEYEDDQLKTLRMDAMEKKDHVTLEIIDNEIESRKNERTVL